MILNKIKTKTKKRRGASGPKLCRQPAHYCAGASARSTFRDGVGAATALCRTAKLSVDLVEPCDGGKRQALTMKEEPIPASRAASVRKVCQAAEALHEVGPAAGTDGRGHELANYIPFKMLDSRMRLKCARRHEGAPAIGAGERAHDA